MKYINLSLTNKQYAELSDSCEKYNKEHNATYNLRGYVLHLLNMYGDITETYIEDGDITDYG